jgi:hypothetical protein
MGIFLWVLYTFLMYLFEWVNIEILDSCQDASEMKN